MARVFEAFYTTKPGGMGMGLGVVLTETEDYGTRGRSEPIFIIVSSMITSVFARMLCSKSGVI